MAKRRNNRIYMAAGAIILVIVAIASYTLLSKDVLVNEDLRHLINADMDTFLAEYPSFSPSGNKIILEEGTYNFDETIIIPKGFSLDIEAGTTLRFGKDKSLVSYSPITAKGTEDNPIIFTSQNNVKWGSLGIVEAEKSIFDHVKFEYGKGTLVNNREFMGSMSLVESGVEISNSQFSNLFGKDGVWALNSDVMIRNNIFNDILVDCLDLDNGSGEVSSNQFINCGDEGIDLSENDNVQVFGNVIINSGNGIDADANLEEIRKLNEIRRLS